MVRSPSIIVDDEDVRREAVVYVEGLGAHAIGPRSRNEAMALLDTTACSVDVILSAPRLRAEGSLGVLRLARQRRASKTKEPTMYLMTGHLDPTAAARSGMAMTTRGLIAEPVGFVTLRAIMSFKAGGSGGA